MALELITAAIQLVSNPFALAGFIGLGVYSQSIWQAARYGVLWGAAVQIFVMALGRADLTNVTALAVQCGLRLAGALIVTIGVFYLYRLVRDRNTGGGPQGPAGGNGTQQPRLRRVK